VLAALDAAEAVYQDPGYLRGYLTHFRKKIGEAPMAGEAMVALFDLFAPYRSTPANIFTRAVQSTPFGFIQAFYDTIALKKMIADGVGELKQVRNILDQAEGLEGVDDALAGIKASGDLAAFQQKAQQRRAAKAAGRAAAGTGALAVGWFLADKITDTYAGTREQPASAGNQARLGDVQYGSIKIWGRTFSIERLGPLASLLLMGSELKKAFDRGDSVFNRLQTFVEDDLLESSPYGNLGEFGEFLGGGDDAGSTVTQRGEDLIASQIGSYVPNILRSGVAGYDATIRERRPGSMLDAVKEGLPGLRQQLPARIGATGQEQTRSPAGWMGVAERLLNPVTSRKVSDDPLIQMLDELDVSLPDARGSIGNLNVQRGTEEYEVLAKVYGRAVTNAINDVMQNGGRREKDGRMVDLTWAEMDAADRKYLIERAASTMKTRVSSELRATGLYN